MYPFMSNDHQFKVSGSAARPPTASHEPRHRALWLGSEHDTVTEPALHRDPHSSLIELAFVPG
jgi:hypothetical protein